ncbi:hypothetical protein [Methylobacterium sp. V23]|uniref:hypothetical protein n=1 Tax=Methylobacterium sp. V23 TaxID=2044878 RepID=UPI000CDB71F4|nr:hypothetical protein [Methylobacterium sp. V23]POR42558.1 hypothetical protein CRT23_12265 [Methylobacterium sp. V23]
MDRAIILLVCLVLLIGVPYSSADAETIGYRVEAQACAGTVCRQLAPSPRTWAGLYACQTRAANLERFGLPGDARAIRARCAAVVGMPRA